MRRSILHDRDPGNDEALGILVACESSNLALNAATAGAGHRSHDSIHQDGFDGFTTTEYAEWVGWPRAALESGAWSLDD